MDRSEYARPFRHYFRREAAQPSSPRRIGNLQLACPPQSGHSLQDASPCIFDSIMHVIQQLTGACSLPFYSSATAPSRENRPVCFDRSPCSRAAIRVSCWRLVSADVRRAARPVLGETANARSVRGVRVMNFTASTLSAASVRAAIGDRVADDGAGDAVARNPDRVRAGAGSQAGFRAARHGQALEFIAGLIHRAAGRGHTELLLMRFPSSWLPDHGRAINNGDRDWPEKFDGFARRAYEYHVQELQPRGFEMRATILDWPDGMPGNVGLFVWHGAA